MKINISKKDVLWSFLGTILNMGANLIVLLFIIHYLNEDMIGLWYIFISIGAITTLFDFGFAVTFARNITYCWSGAIELKKEDVVHIKNQEPDFYLMKKILYTSKWIYLLFSLAALFLILTWGTSCVIFVSREISGYTHIIAWIIFAFASFLNLYYGYFAVFLRGVGAIDAANINTVIARTVQIIFTVILLVLGTGLIGACLSYLLYGLIFRMLGKYTFYHYCNIGNELDAIDAKFSFADIKEMFLVIWHNAWRDGVISLSSFLNNQASTLICSMYLTLAETGIYSLGVQIASAIATIAGTLYFAYQPMFQEAYINKNLKKMRATMSIIVMSFIYLFVIGTVGILFVGLPLLRLIKPEITISMTVLLGLSSYQFILKFRNCYASYFSCTNRIPYISGFIISSIINVVLSFIMIGPLHLEVLGLIAAQVISQAIYNVWYWPIKAHKEMNLTVKDMINLGNSELKQIIKSIFSFTPHETNS